MSTEDPDMMEALDARLRKLHAGLDAPPGFEARLAARIAAQRAQHGAQHGARRAGTLAAIERDLARERARARRDALAESIVLGVAGLGAAAAAWQLGPACGRWLGAALAGAGPVAVGFGTLPLAAVLLWGLLRQFDVDPRRLIGA